VSEKGGKSLPMGEKFSWNTDKGQITAPGGCSFDQPAMTGDGFA